MIDYNELALQKHLELRGKLAVHLKDDLDSQEKLSIYYTPGVGAVSSHLAHHPEDTRKYTWTNNLVAVISDGSAVLGLGNIGPRAALPVMEGKAMLFKHFANIDAIPIVLDVHSADDIVAAVAAIAPSFGGINLEDIAAPICFEVEQRLKQLLPIPVMHDDQHGTAIVVLAGLINAVKLTDRKLSQCKLVLVGTGAAAVAVAKLLLRYAPGINILAVDSQGILSSQRNNLNDSKQALLKLTNSDDTSGSLANGMHGADIFIGVSRANLLDAAMIKTMAKDPIVIALANPVPEVMPEVARAAGVRIIATGRSDYPNQINNALAFPGIFRGALDNGVRMITDAHKIQAAETMAALVQDPTPGCIIPMISNPRLVPAIADIIR